MLQFVRIRDMILYVKKSSKKSSLIPAWVGGQMAISDLLSESLRKEIDICNKLENNNYLNPELNSLLPILNKQKALSNIPKKDEFLIEIYKTKDFSNLFVFTLDGKFVNEGIAFLWALRLAKLKQSTFSITANDFGFSLTTAEDYDFSIIKKEADYFLNNKKLEEDLENAINFSELTKRRFKNIAQISGLVNQNNPTKTKTSSQLQISSSLFYDVFTKYEEGHLLIKQSHQEVKEYQLENKRISRSLERLKNLKMAITAGIGSDHVDLQAAMDNKIDVVEVTFCNSRSVAEHIVMMIVSMVRDYHNQHRIVNEGGWNIADAVQRSYDVEGMHIGTVAAGRIGLDALRKMKPFDTHLHYFDRHRLPDSVEKN